MSRAHNKYLNSYAEPQSQTLATRYAASASTVFHTATVVPAFDESSDSVLRIINHCLQGASLPVIVVNAPDDAAPAQRERTQDLLVKLLADETPACVVDCVTDPLPRRRGVGLARKLGTDLALHLIDAGIVHSPWIYQTDADVWLPQNYFHTPLPEAGAAVFAHRHISSKPHLQKAADLYDLHMALYIAGLAFAGSRYAYPTLGSTLAVHAEAYAQVRGYPKRDAAEDFYLLNKINKVANVHYIDAIDIGLEARLSHRVPFGTGPALASIVAELEVDPRGNTYTSYDPNVFVALKIQLEEFQRFARGELNSGFSHAHVLSQLGWDTVAEGFANPAWDDARRTRAISEWFDGFRTLRFVRELCHEIPQRSLLDILAELDTEMLEHVHRYAKSAANSLK